MSSHSHAHSPQREAPDDWSCLDEWGNYGEDDDGHDTGHCGNTATLACYSECQVAWCDECAPRVAAPVIDPLSVCIAMAGSRFCKCERCQRIAASFA